MQLSFFKTRKPKQFEYKPRYYDPEKEAQEKRQKEINAGGANDYSHLRSEMDRRWHRDSRKSSRDSKTRLVVIYIIIALLLLYFIFFV